MDIQMEFGEETFEELETSLLSLMDVQSEDNSLSKRDCSSTHLVDTTIKFFGGAMEGRNTEKEIPAITNKKQSHGNFFFNCMSYLHQQSTPFNSNTDITFDKIEQTEHDSGYFEMCIDDEGIDMLSTIKNDNIGGHQCNLPSNDKKQLMDKPNFSPETNISQNIVIYTDDDDDFLMESIHKQTESINEEIKDNDYSLKTASESCSYDELVVNLDDSGAFESDNESTEQLYKNNSKDDIDVSEKYDCSDNLVLYIDDSETSMEDSSNEEEKYDDKIKESEEANRKQQNLSSERPNNFFNDVTLPKLKKKYKSRGSAVQTIRNWIVRNKNDTIYENTNSKQWESVGKEKCIFVSDDPEENYDINHPEWKAISHFTSNEDCYRLVKRHWGSKQIPNPRHDLTFHSYRLKRMNQSLVIVPNTSAVKHMLSNDCTKQNGKECKRKLPCTIIVDRKISSMTKEFKDNWKNRKRLLKEAYKEINNKVSRENIKFEYMKKLKRFYRNEQSHNLKKQLTLQRRKLLQKYQSQHVKIRRAYYDCRQKENANLVLTTKRLKEAKEEIFEFNQFYSHLNNVDTINIEGKLLEDVERINSMYQQYDYYYSQ